MDKAGGVSGGGVTKKQQHPLIELLLQYDFEEVYDRSIKLIEKRASHENTFKISTKILNIIANSFSKKEHLKLSYPIFMKWFNLAINFQQELLCRSYIIYYAIIYGKNLINEYIYVSGIAVLDMLQDIYTFLPDMKTNPLQTNERYIKFLAPLSYNSALRKDLIIENESVSIDLFVHGVKFYLKLLGNYSMLLDSIRGFEMKLIKTNHVEKFYAIFFKFLQHSLVIDDNDDELVECKKVKGEVSKFGHLLKFYMSLFLQYVFICFNAQLKKGRQNLDGELKTLSSFFKRSKFTEYKSEFTRKELDDLKHTTKILEITELTIKYAEQLNKLKNTSSSGQSLINQNNKVEIELKELFDEIYSSTDNTNYHQLSTLTQTFENIYAIFYDNFNDSTGNSKLIQISLIELSCSIMVNYSNIIQKLYKRHHQPERISKSSISKPMQFFLVAEKLVEQSAKISRTSKWLNSQEGTDCIEQLYKSHGNYLKWSQMLKLFTPEELTKQLNNLECQSIRICTALYTEDILPNYIKFQWIALQTSIDKLKFQFSMNKDYFKDTSVLKHLHSVCENLLLSLRLKNKFKEALETLRIAYEFISMYDLDELEMEWLVTNCCKIKRDLWKVKSKEYKEMTIVDLLNIKEDLVDKYLFQEIRLYNTFKAADSSVNMNDEIYHTLVKLDNLTSRNHLLRSRIQLEIAQFTWLKYDDINCKFSLSSDKYIERAQTFLKSHSCLTQDFIELDLNKENTDNENNLSLSPLSPSKTSLNDSIVLMSPNENISNRKDNVKKAANLNRHKRLQNTKSPMVKATKSSQLCSCITTHLVKFQLDMYKMLAAYAKQRAKSGKYVSNLIQSRMKMKETTTVVTNADNLNLATASSSHLICPEICDETGLKIDDSFLIKKLDECFTSMEYLVSSTKTKTSFAKEEKSLKKQFYEQADLLAQLYGFFGMLTSRIKVFTIKLDLLNFDQKNSQNTDYDNISTTTLLHLMKAYLNANMFDEFLSLVFDDRFGKGSKSEPTKENSPRKINYQNIEKLEKLNKNVSSKPETLIAYHLALAHYLILKHQIDDAMRLIKNKVETSPIINGKLTAYHYEIKYYLRYLQFMVSIANVGKSEAKLKAFVGKETPLSLLEECYVSAFSVARYFVQNSVEPSRAFGTASSNDKASNIDDVFFDIGNSESYRILSESLDIMQEMCKYYIEISRYRDALGYIREGLDITQLHFSNRRVVQFLLHQANADLIAACLNESTARLKLSENLLDGLDEDYKRTDLKNMDIIDLNDLFGLKNLVHFNNLKMLNDIKLNEQMNSSGASDTIQLGHGELVKRLSQVHTALSDFKQLNDFCIDLLIDAYFIVCNYLKQFRLTSDLKMLLKQLKSLVIRKSSENGAKMSSKNENWHLAEFYCLVYEIDSNMTGLNLAYSAIKSNPHPTLYRRICFHLYQAEKCDKHLKIEYLLETQSIALRHKTCSIQLKNKRKLSINEELFAKITASLNFDGTVNILDQLDDLLPQNVVVTALVMKDSGTLCIIRLEKGIEPVLYKLKYDQKYSDEFKQIIAENDMSMKQSERLKFWSTRNQLNQRLATFSENLDHEVLSYGKGLLLGSFTNTDIDLLVDKMRKELRLGVLNQDQNSLLRVLMIGVEHLNLQEIKDGLKTDFIENVSEMANYLIEMKAKLSNLPRKHVCLLVDKYIHQIPWESLPSTKKQPISRMPSIHFLMSHLQVNSFSINKDNAYYIVDPGGDLTYTKQKFQPFFERKKSWKGLIGVAPDEVQFKKALTDYDIFIYTGHGSGSQYYPSDEVQKIRIQACSILMGCSSGNQYVLGEFEPYGTVLAYIIAGCPCIVGNLWDVTDRDIDRLTEDFLESWLKDTDNEKKSNDSYICDHLNKSRQACKMVYLNGSAPIIYGLPVNFK